MQITLDPRLKYNYASWYLLGISKLFGQKNISFDVQPFITLLYNSTRDYNSGFAFIISDGTDSRKIFIDTEDVAVVFEDRYRWCDVYGMVNPTAEQTSAYSKLVAIGPEFGITLSSRYLSVIHCCRAFIAGRRYTSIPFKIYLRDYLYTNIRRRRLEAYETPCNIKANYIFHASTLWYNDFAAANTNRYRGEFLEACQKACLEIEGGLYYIDGPAVLAEMPDYPKYKEIYKEFIYDKRLSMDDYIRKTKESVMVFNTPSVCGCHGWKLAEYLCMGKAIVSTPLTRELPAPVVHGENIHFVHSTEEMYQAVVRINTDEAYRRKLERGARAYYEKWLAPEVVIRRLVAQH